MFESEVGVRVSHITVNQLEQEDHEVPLVVMTCEVSPFTAARAGEMHDKVKRILYTARDAAVDSLIKSVSFDLEFSQSIEVRMAPDQAEPSFTIEEAKINGIRAKRSKKSSAWTLEFKVICSPQSEHQLAQIAESYLKTKYFTFSEAEPDLFSESRAAEAKARRDAANDDADAGISRSDGAALPH